MKSRIHNSRIPLRFDRVQSLIKHHKPFDCSNGGMCKKDIEAIQINLRRAGEGVLFTDITERLEFYRKSDENEKYRNYRRGNSLICT